MTSLDPAAVEALLTRAAKEVDAGLLPSCQLALALDGEVLVHEAFGAATTGSRYTIFSATKPVVASVIWQLMGEGAVAPDTRIADVIPEFGTHGKDVITLDQVLQHTAGFPRGLVVAGDDGRANLRGMGRTASPATFGHNGAAGQVAWADPASGLSFAYLTNGRDLNVLREHRRTTALGSLAARCAT